MEEPPPCGACERLGTDDMSVRPKRLHIPSCLSFKAYRPETSSGTPIPAPPLDVHREMCLKHLSGGRGCPPSLGGRPQVSGRGRPCGDLRHRPHSPGPEPLPAFRRLISHFMAQCACLCGPVVAEVSTLTGRRCRQPLPPCRTPFASQAAVALDTRSSQLVFPASVYTYLHRDSLALPHFCAPFDRTHC